MNQMEGYKELLDKLNELVKSLENGELSLDELTTLEEVTRKLHERSIILRYKAFETSVLGNTSEEEEAPVVETPMAEPEPTPEPVEEVPEKEEETAFDFAIFNENSEEEVSNELPIMDISTKEEEAPEEVTPEPESEPVPEIVEEPVAEIAPEVEEAPEVVVDEAKVTEEASDESVTTAAETQSTSTGSSFLDKFSQQDNSVGSRFSAGPLDSLIGAFGLNERLRFINDLFDGSSEKFSDAIKALDTQPGLDDARQKAAGYAEENDWDPEEEVVTEFMNYLNRRYA